MNKIAVKNRFWVITAVSCVILTFSASTAFAWGPGPGHDRRYHWRDDRWYGPGWLGFEVAASALTIGAIVASLPRGYNTVVVSGAPYYYYDGYYFRSCPDGYVVVPAPAPVVVAAPSAVLVPASAVVAVPNVPSADTFVVNVPNSGGGYTAVTLVKHGNGYVGPQGEYYQGHPTIDQLKVLYGK